MGFVQVENWFTEDRPFCNIASTRKKIENAKMQKILALSSPSSRGKKIIF